MSRAFLDPLRLPIETLNTTSSITSRRIIVIHRLILLRWRSIFWNSGKPLVSRQIDYAGFLRCHGWTVQKQKQLDWYFKRWERCGIEIIGAHKDNYRLTSPLATEGTTSKPSNSPDRPSQIQIRPRKFVVDEFTINRRRNCRTILSISGRLEYEVLCIVHCYCACT